MCELRALHAFLEVVVNFAYFFTLKNRCFFVEGIANLRFLRFLIFPLVVISETSFWIHFGSLLGSKIVKNRSRTGFGKMMTF